MNNDFFDKSLSGMVLKAHFLPVIYPGSLFQIECNCPPFEGKTFCQ